MSISQLVAEATSSGVYLYTEGGQLKYKLSVTSFPDEIKQRILKHKQAVIQFLDQVDAESKPQITALASYDGLFPLSYAQQRLWFIDRFEGQSAQYNIPKAIKVSGSFSIDIAEKAIERLIWRHQILRTTYVEIEGEPRQQVNSDFVFQVKRIDLTGIDSTTQDSQLDTLITHDARANFDLSNDLMLRASFIVTSAVDQGVLLFNMHHIASDGWSMNILIREFIAEYTALMTGQPSRSIPLEIQYVDFAQWQQDWLTESRLANELNYWQKQLADAPLLHGLPLDKPRPSSKGNHGAKVTSSYSASAIIEFAKSQGMTPFMVFHAALSIVLCRHSNQREFIIGTPVANRQDCALSPLIGFFVNTLILKSSMEHGSVLEFLHHIRDTNLAAQSHQDLPFEQIVEHCQVERSLQHTPIFQVMLSMFQESPNSSPQLALQGVQFDAISKQVTSTKYDLDIGVSMIDNQCSVTWVYDTDLFHAQTIELFDSHFNRVLTSLLQQPQDLPLSQLMMLSDIEQQYLTETLNDTDRAYEQNVLLHELFERQAAANSQAIAVVSGAEQLT
ncbi:condensation domain-containing protein, partial [Pseudoalteromonas sp. MMG012]|uniref:condensation domain-containing protein n=1 Tax=Pseudoalteromonas sp. MMG012 TaxID=2822686 RepID=UPI001B50546A